MRGLGTYPRQPPREQLQNISPTVNHPKACLPVSETKRIDQVRVSRVSSNAQPDVSACRSLTSFNRRTAIVIAIFLRVNCCYFFKISDLELQLLTLSRHLCSCADLFNGDHPCTSPLESPFRCLIRIQCWCCWISSAVGFDKRSHQLPARTSELTHLPE
jgi:hypothetical protein